MRGQEGLEYVDSRLLEHYSVNVSNGRKEKSSTRRLSQSPFAILARVLAEVGAIRRTCAHRLSSICNMGSLSSCQVFNEPQIQGIRV